MEKGHIICGDTKLELTREQAGSYQSVSVSGDHASVELYLDMPSRYTVSHALVEENTCQAAVERGPLVYCIENPDSELDTLDDLMLDPMETFHPVPMQIERRDVMALEGSALAVCHEEDYDPGALYQTLSVRRLTPTKIRMIPYFAWDNRGYGEMKIWMPVALRQLP